MIKMKFNSMAPQERAVPIPSPEALGLAPTLELSSAPRSKTFHYWGEDKRVLESAWAGGRLLRKVKGPCIYVVADFGNVVRYIGKHSAATPIGRRWCRRGHIHHAQSRNHVIRELDAGAQPFMVWSSSVEALRGRLAPGCSSWDAERIAQGLEALWLSHWFEILWNEKREPLVSGFDDNNYWQFAD